MMLTSRKFVFWIVLLTLILLSSFVVDLFCGSYQTDSGDLFNSLFSFDSNDTGQLVFREFRIPRALTALFAGASLSVCGLLMQTLFNNPLAGPYVLGISSGSSLFVALGSMTGVSFFLHDAGMITSAIAGALIFGGIILVAATKIRSQVTLLLVGLMLGSMSGALITMLEATASAQELRAYTMWTMGSLQHIQFSQLPVFMIVLISGLVGTLFLIKPLNTLVLGEEQATLLGIPVRKVRFLTILITAILSGTVTAYCGPIAFVGLAVPNIVKLLLKTADHSKLLLGSLLLGATFLLLTDTLIQMLEPYLLIPVNALTSLIGAPIIIFLLLKRWA